MGTKVCRNLRLSIRENGTDVHSVNTRRRRQGISASLSRRTVSEDEPVLRGAHDGSIVPIHTSGENSFCQICRARPHGPIKNFHTSLLIYGFCKSLDCPWEPGWFISDFSDILTRARRSLVLAWESVARFVRSTTGRVPVQSLSLYGASRPISSQNLVSLPALSAEMTSRRNASDQEAGKGDVKTYVCGDPPLFCPI
ncbi:hypothetical protein RRG08_004310 [Elysia crispata]|uniref:Uncharacterized protein n=1 Tax=Elysia crispata TaxID=231223 RepID=A0AAE0YC10_9GAST|nr:hypothetical protein RRG08_004310 [Elysia crispata]